MTLQLSARHAYVSQSEIRSMTRECVRLGGINLAQGVCDLPVPGPVLKGAKQAMDAGFNIYTPCEGLMDLRRAVAARAAAFNKIEADPETEVVVSIGATGAFYSACLSLLEPGDHALVFEPFYGYHVNTLRTLDIGHTSVRLEPPDWGFSRQDLEAAATDKTRLIVLNTPLNPCGKVFTRAELEVIADFARARDLFVFSDEIYEHFVYDGREHVSPASLPGMFERTVTLSGFSKVFAVTGWRLGYAIAHKRWAATMAQMNDLVYVCAPAPLQLGAAKGLNDLGPEYYETLARDHQAKRERICNALDSGGLAPHVPQGAYYVLADISALPGENDKDKAMGLLEATGVACVPGRAFYDAEPPALGRFCFAKQDHDLEEACRRLEKLGA